MSTEFSVMFGLKNRIHEISVYDHTVYRKEFKKIELL